jgi:hypothetical protein
LALPIEGSNDATYLAAEAVAISSAPPGAPPTAGLGAVSALLGGQPQLAENNATEAWNALVAPGDPAAAGVHAVAMTEQQLFSRASNLPSAKDVVAQWIPDGPVAMADYPPSCWPAIGFPRSRSVPRANSPGSWAGRNNSRRWPGPGSEPMEPPRRRATW